MTDEGRKALASSIFSSFKTYKEKFESRQNLASNLPETEPKEREKLAVNQGPIPSGLLKDTSVKHIEVSVNKDKTAKIENIIQPVIKADQITFAIQISAFPKKLPLNSSIFKGIKNITEIVTDGYFKYYCFDSKSLAEVRQNISTIRNKIPGAFIVAFRNGQPIPIKEALNAR
jgi:hypothetical protein